MSGSTRVGRRGLESRAAQLSERDWQIIGSVAAHRFLTTRQLQALHFADHATELAGARACRRVVERLRSGRVLTNLRRRVGGVRAGSASFVWTLDVIGDRLLQQRRGESRRRRVHEPSTAFLDHTLAIADVHIELVGAERAGGLELVRIELEPDCWRTFLSGSGGREVLRPDLYAVVAEPGSTTLDGSAAQSNGFEDCWFIEVDRGTESLPTVLRKCGQYESYRRSGREQQQLGTFPRVLWLVPDDRRRARLAGAVGSARNLVAEMFIVAKADDLLSTIGGSRP